MQRLASPGPAKKVFFFCKKSLTESAVRYKHSLVLRE